MATDFLFEVNEPKWEEKKPVDLKNISAATIYSKSLNKKEIRDLRRKQTAKEAMEGFEKGLEIFGFTKGQFSLCDLLAAILDKTGKSELVISTWTAAHTDITNMIDLINSGKITKTKWLVDISLQRRAPALTKAIRDRFGDDAIRIAKNHAKFMLIGNKDWKVVIRTSMNLNYNPRFEDFTVAHDPDLYDFMKQIIDEIWAKQNRDLANQNPYSAEKFFFEEM